jgi:hypothetical protein
LDVPFLILYGETGPARLPVLMRRTGAWDAVDRAAMRRTGYPHPGGDAYLVAEVEPVQDQPLWISALRADDLPRAGHLRAPFTRTWLDLVPDN